MRFRQKVEFSFFLSHFFYRSICSQFNQEALQGKLESLEGRLKIAIKDLNGAKQNARFDKVALEGRTKTALILEHTVATLRHDLQTNVERRQVQQQSGAEQRIYIIWQTAVCSAAEKFRRKRTKIDRGTHPTNHASNAVLGCIGQARENHLLFIYGMKCMCLRTLVIDIGFLARRTNSQAVRVART